MARPEVNDLIRLADRQMADRGVYASHCDEINKLIFPFGPRFQSTQTPGQKVHQDVLDGTGEQAAETLAAALFGMLTNPATRWMELDVEDEAAKADFEVATWLEDSSRRMNSVFNQPKHGFATAEFELNMDEVSYGSAGQYIAEIQGFGPLFQTRPLPELTFAEDHTGRVDTVIRHFRMRARNEVQQFGNRASEQSRNKAGDPNRADEEADFLHITVPREDADPFSPLTSKMPWAEYYVNKRDKQLVREGGFPEFPWVAPRWFRRAGEVYGRGPGHKALGDVKSLQRGMKINFRGAEKVIDPPIQVADDGVMRPIRMTASGINYVRPDLMRQREGGIRAILTGARPDLGDVFFDKIRERVERAFYFHLLQMFQDPRMTATQVLQIAEETLRILGPHLGRQESENLGPKIERTFAIMLRQAMFLPVPRGLAGRTLTIKYESPLAKQQRLADARGIAQTMDLMAPLSGVKPEIWDNVDGDATFRKVADLFGWPKSTLASIERVREVRQARAEAQRQEMAGQDLAQGVELLGKVLPAVTGNDNRRAA